MADGTKNSLDFLRLVAATMVLYSHQYALSGLPEPLFMGWNTFGGAGVTIFFFLSGFLVWTSWERDPALSRFFARRSLRIFPALWVVCLGSVFLLGPILTTLGVGEYFASRTTWRYLGTLALISTNTLPGLFPQNPMPFVVNGSLWTLPVEFLCYLTVAVVGMVVMYFNAAKGFLLGVVLLTMVLIASYGTLLIGPRFSAHLEMVAMFWWGVFYGYCVKDQVHRTTLILAVIALLAFALLGTRGFERTAMLACAAILVHATLRVAAGAKVTDRLGDLSYGVYIFAFPVQQLGVSWVRGQSWSVEVSFCASFLMTFALAYLSWHFVEKPALRFKPKIKGRQ